MAVQSAASISRVLALSVSVLSRHFLLFFPAGAIASLPLVLLGRLLRSEQIFTLSISALLRLLVYALLTRLLMIICDCTVTMPVAFQAVRQQPFSFINSLKAGLPRVIPVMLTEIITVVLAMIAMLLSAAILGLILGLILGSMSTGAVPVLIALAFVPAELLLTTWLVGAPVCLIERTGPWISLRRSVDLTKGHFWIILGLLLFLRIGALITTELFPSLGLGEHTVLIISACLCYAIWLPYSSIVLVTIYHDLRVTQEGVQQIA